MLTEQIKQRFFVLHLSLIEGVGPSVIAHIVRYKLANSIAYASWDDMYAFSPTDWITIGISQKIAPVLASGLSDYALLEQELVHIERSRVAFVTVYDDAYSSLLKHINQPPAVLYYKGAAFESHTKNVAIVGSRAADFYAQKVIDSFVPSLVAHGWSIISGGAVGADSMAHHAALRVCGKTVAVLGSGLLRPYPKNNTRLFEQIVENGGTLVSSFPLTVEPIAGNFPARNRIIAGLSSGCIVVQAAQKSGASITAQYALDQGRSVFAVPGMIDNPLSVGCHKLLHEGATVADCVETILADLGELVPKPASTVQQLSILDKAVPAIIAHTVVMHDKTIKDREAKKKMDLEPYPASHVQKNTINNSHVNLSTYASDSIEYQIICFCVKPRSVDEIALHCSLVYAQALHILFDLQLDDVVCQNFAGQWVSR